MTVISSQAPTAALPALARLTGGWSTQFLRFIERHGVVLNEIIQIHNEIDRRRLTNIPVERRRQMSSSNADGLQWHEHERPQNPALFS